jgi:hypothetical protein
MDSTRLQTAGIPGGREDTPHGSLRAWFELVVAIVLGLFLLLLALGFIGEATSSHRASAGASRPVDAILAVVFILLAALCGWWAVSAEHRLRRHNPVAASFAADPFGRSPNESSGLETTPPAVVDSAPPAVLDTAPLAVEDTTAAPRTVEDSSPPDTPPQVTYATDTAAAILEDPGNRSTFASVGPQGAGIKKTVWSSSRAVRRRRYGPVTLVILTVAFAFGAVALAIGAIISVNQAARSSYVQAHGIKAVATVVWVYNTQHCNSNNTSCYYTSQIDVTLRPPVDGVSSTTVNAPFESALNPGDVTPVLVDPHDLGYAEFPGSPYVTASQWILLGAIGVVIALVDIAFIVALVAVLKHRHAARALGAPAAAAA